MTGTAQHDGASVSIRPARPGEAALLTELCLRSKAVWGYDPAFMAACRTELTITVEMIAGPNLAVAEIDGRVAGLVQLAIRGPVAELDKLFVEPDRLHGGVGRLLFAWAARRARRSGAALLVIDADPGAAAFYRRLGASDAGVVPSGSIPGRFIPRLEFALQR